MKNMFTLKIYIALLLNIMIRIARWTAGTSLGGTGTGEVPPKNNKGKHLIKQVFHQSTPR